MHSDRIVLAEKTSRFCRLYKPGGMEDCLLGKDFYITSVVLKNGNVMVIRHIMLPKHLNEKIEKFRIAVVRSTGFVPLIPSHAFLLVSSTKAVYGMTSEASAPGWANEVYQHKRSSVIAHHIMECRLAISTIMAITGGGHPDEHSTAKLYPQCSERIEKSQAKIGISSWNFNLHDEECER